MSDGAPVPPRPPKRPRPDHETPAPALVPVLPDEVIVEHILTRVTTAATVRFRAVCRSWRAALTSDHFVQSYQAARAAAAQPPEIVFFVPGAAGSTSYSSRLNVSSPDDAPPALARELVTVGNLRASDLVMSGTKSCRGLTLLFQPGESAYHVINLSTGEHVSLPPCAWAYRALPYGPYVLSSAGLCFDPAANEHKVVRIFEDWGKRQHCEVYGLRSGGWRPFAGRVPPPHAVKGLIGRPPVFADGRFYWNIHTGFNFSGWENRHFATPEPILSLAVGTEEFGWVPPPPPEERSRSHSRYAFHLAELDGRLCAVVDRRLFVERYELWTWTAAAAAAAGSASPPAWSLRCCVDLATLPRPTREDLSRGIRVLPLGLGSSGGKILLATSRHEVYAYDPESNGVERVFSVLEFMDAPREPELLFNVALHEETVTGVRRRHGAGDDDSKLEVKLGRSSVASRRGGTAEADDLLREDVSAAQRQVQRMLSVTRAVYRSIVDKQITYSRR